MPLLWSRCNSLSAVMDHQQLTLCQDMMGYHKCSKGRPKLKTCLTLNTMKYSYWNMSNLKCTSSSIWLWFELHIAGQPVWLSPYVEFTVDPIKAAPPNKQSEYHLPTAQHSWREPLGWLQLQLTWENNKHDTKATLLFKASICHPILCAIPFLEYHSRSWCLTSSAEKRIFPDGRGNWQEAHTTEDETS